MQLTIEVLPAPLGPIIENSSPSFTPKLTSVSARTPPKRSDTPRTSKACSTYPLRQDVHGASGALLPRSTRFIAMGQPVSATLARQRPHCRRRPSALIRSTLVLDFTGVEWYGLRRECKAPPARFGPANRDMIRVWSTR